MKVKIISQGMGRNTKVVNEATGEEIENINNIVVHISPGGFTEVTLGIFNVKCEIQSEKVMKEITTISPMKEKKKRVRKTKSSTQYTLDSLKKNLDKTEENKGLSDVKKSEKYGINPDTDMLSWRIWHFLTKWWYSGNRIIGLNKRDLEFTTKDIIAYLNDEEIIKTKFNGKEIQFNRTTVNHSINRFAAFGLLSKKNTSAGCIYKFHPYIKKKGEGGLDWFRIDNIFMRTSFQWEKGKLGMIDTPGKEEPNGIADTTQI